MAVVFNHWLDVLKPDEKLLNSIKAISCCRRCRVLLLLLMDDDDDDDATASNAHSIIAYTQTLN